VAEGGLKVMIAGGGTGGHFFSGVAVGEAFHARSSETQVVYVGTRRGIEARVGPKEGLDVRFIEISGVRGRGLLHRLRALLQVPKAIIQSLALLRSEDPDIVMGVGGYASGPVVLAAWLTGRCTGIVEQNSVAGTTNRFLGPFVKRIFVAFEAACVSFPGSKVHVTGNPIRSGVVELLTLDSTGTVGIGQRLKLLVVGGSQGARPINEAMMDAVQLLPKELHERLYITHQTGDADCERVSAAYVASGVEGQVTPFIGAMAEAYRAADVVLCRAGALTVSELSISQRGALLVPYPQAIDNHQERNAQVLVDAGGGEMILQESLSGELLVNALQRFIDEPRSLQEMAWKAGTLARPQAAVEVVDEMYRAIGRP
jgi:UDP-N-acetylglucosamine--N-acetylmuramyl-(pentapeptide) pyrophosphoryl-undecaprenol N-acetylglucosamine transferase